MINHWILGYSNKSKWSNWINGIWYWVCHSALWFLLVSRRHHLLLHSSYIASRFRSRFYTDQREAIWSCYPPLLDQNDQSQCCFGWSLFMLMVSDLSPLLDGFYTDVVSDGLFLCSWPWEFSSAKEREKIFLVHLKPITLQADLNVEDVAKRMASLTPGFVGADIVTRLDLLGIPVDCKQHASSLRIFSYFSWWAKFAWCLHFDIRRLDFIFGNFLDLSLVSCWEFFRLGIFHCALWSLSIHCEKMYIAE